MQKGKKVFARNGGLEMLFELFNDDSLIVEFGLADEENDWNGVYFGIFHLFLWLGIFIK